MESLIFDIDGTLWDSRALVAEGYNLQLHDEGLVGYDTNAEELKTLFGKTMTEIADILFPDIPQEQRYELMQRCMDRENAYLAQSPCRVGYEGIVETLESLARDYRLFIVSNCQSGYIEAFLHAHNLSSYFEDTECWGRTRATKGESNRILIARNNLKNPVYVGDTIGDAKSAADAGIPFIYAAYGFGTVDKYDYSINRISELTDIV